MASSAADKSSALRFADLGMLPKRMLAPIEGYEKMPVVSLGEAVKPLVNIVPKVERNVFIIKQNCQEPKDGLTSDESASIMLYTYESEPHEDSLYFILNATLRSEQRQKLKPWFSYLRLILTALARLPSERHFVNRGVREDLRNQYPIGKSFVWWSFSSCTSDVGVLECESFFGQTGTRTLFQIDCHSGKDVKNHSFIQNEDEILLLPARQFEVKAILNAGNDLHIIQIKETVPTYPLLEPISLPTPMSQTKKIPPTPSPSGAQKLISPKSSMFLINLSPTARWAQNGVTVAGGHDKGEATDQLYNPKGLHADEEGTVIVADWENHRIVEWKRGDTSGRVLAGGNGEGNRPDQLYRPANVLVDPATDSLIICDRKNRRVARWSRGSDTQSGETIIANIDCWGLAMGDEGCLYVTDYKKHEVRRYRQGETSGTVVAGGNGSGGGLHQLNSPIFVCVDGDHAVYVSDNYNHRVMKWVKGANEGIVVAGGKGKGQQLTQLSNPHGVRVDAAGTVYVADFGNHRVMRWCRGATQGTVVVGGNGRGEGANQFHCPSGLSFDRQGNLFVADCYNNRVQRFSLEKN